MYKDLLYYLYEETDYSNIGFKNDIQDASLSNTRRLYFQNITREELVTFTVGSYSSDYTSLQDIKRDYDILANIYGEDISSIDEPLDNIECEYKRMLLEGSSSYEAMKNRLVKSKLS